MNVQGKRGVVLGVLNKRSMAAHCASRLLEQGAEVICSYLPVSGDEERRHVLATRAVPGIPSNRMLPCDVTDEESVAHFFSQVELEFSTIDFVIHSIAYVPVQELSYPLTKLSRNDFCLSMDITVYSLIVVSRYLQGLMTSGGSLVTFSYLSAEATVPGYEVLGICKAALQSVTSLLASELGSSGIRVNAVSAPPFASSSASGNPCYTDLQEAYSNLAPLRKALCLEDIIDLVQYLVSSMSAGITGERIFVDGGFNKLSAAVCTLTNNNFPK